MIVATRLPVLVCGGTFVSLLLTSSIINRVRAVRLGRSMIGHAITRQGEVQVPPALTGTRGNVRFHDLSSTSSIGARL